VRVRSKRKKKLLYKKIWICERRLFHLSRRLFFFGARKVQKKNIMPRLSSTFGDVLFCNLKKPIKNDKKLRKI
jgi:hypothetical protein